ncbi:MAG: hypothetical protein A3K68_04085 [Euryarchaeota archaeon RBG_16_68_13]|nr:MAG: hypothetical protein A3K68_04085 [Euryarchaeota archaeon RBG_16_68_13]
MSRASTDALWHVLSLTDPQRGDVPDFRELAGDGRLLRASLDLASANGLAYPFLERLAAEDVPLPAEARRRWEDESQAAEQFRATVAALNDTSQGTGVAYAVIKACAAVEHVPRDVDIFLAGEGQETFLADLERKGFRPAYRDEAEIALAADGRLRTDVYSRIHYMGRDFVRGGFLLGSARPGSNLGTVFPTLAPEAAYLVNSAHGVFGHAAMSLLDFFSFNDLERRIDDANRVRGMAAELGWGRVLDRWTDRLDAMRDAVYGRQAPVTFPARHGRRFVLDCVAALDAPRLTTRDVAALRLSLVWDDLLFVSEHTGLDGVVRGSRTLAGIANAAGHRLRMLRGDRKGLYADTDKRRWERSENPMR